METKYKSFTKIFNIFLILIIININFSVQQNSDKLNNNVQLDIREYNINDKSKKRKLDDDCPPLNISIDLINFNCTFPNDTIGKGNKDLIIESIYKAKYFIEDFINICNYAEGTYFSVEKFPDWSIKYWDEEIKEGHTKDIDLDVNNYYIFFNFSNSIKNTASSKIVLTTGAPLVGVITINEQIEKSKLDKDYLTTLMIHQIIHLLGFHIETDELFDESIIEEEEEIDENGESIIKYYVSTDNVLEYAINYFNCPDISKIELELDEDRNVHWPSRYFLGELMTEPTYPEEQILSGFTLAFLEDLHYLEVTKKYTGGMMSFGKNKGCDFLRRTCSQLKLSSEIKVANEFYLPEITSDTEISNFEPSCSSSRLSKTVHKLYQMEEPDKYEYYQSGYAGRKSTNYCPISEYNEIDSNYIYTGRCSTFKTSLNPSLEDKLGEKFTENSFCVLSSLVEKNININSEMRAVCYEMICSDLSLTIIIRNNYIVCPREGGLITAKDFKGYLSCPDFNLICGGKDKKLCNNIFNCYENEVEEKDVLNYNYDIKTTQNSDIYKSSEPELSIGWEEDENGFCPQYCMQCDPKPNKKCYQCAPGYEYNEQQNKCISTDINCDKFLSNGICEICKESFFLAEEDNGKLLCEESTNEIYYYPQEGKNYKVKCKKIFNNCNTCDETEEKCLTCLDNYGLYFDGSKCIESTSNLYYKEDEVYKLCSEYIPEKNCEKCQITEDNKYICLECKENYGLIHGDEEPFPCELISSLPEKKYFSEDGKNYYKCENNDIENCNLCERKNECEECKAGYYLENAKTLCISSADKESNMYAYNPKGFLILCSSLIEDCNECENYQNCLNCKDGSGLTNNNKCISESIVEQNHNYYKDETTNRYISCSIIENCISCTSSTICISCKNGYKINSDNICEKVNDKDDNDLSKGAIAGIVIGCFLFLVLIIIGGYFLYKNVLNKKNSENIHIENTEEKDDKNQENQDNKEDKEIEEQLEEKNVAIHKTKRSIHNNNKI